MSLHLLLVQYSNSLDFDKIEDYQYQVGDIWVSPLANHLVEPNDDKAFRKFIIRNIEDKDKTEIFYSIGLTRNKVIHSYGKCRQHKNFSKIIKAVNDMRTQPMETVLVYVGEWTTEFGWQQQQFIKDALNIPDGQPINPLSYKSQFFSLDEVDKLEQVYRGEGVEVHCFIRANPILLPAILNLTTGFKSVYSCNRCPDQGDTKLQKCPPQMGRYWSESTDPDATIIHNILGN